MVDWSLADAAPAMGGRIELGDPEQRFNGASIDTRALSSGNIFFCLAGKTDGHRFVDDAIAAGAAGIVVCKDYPTRGIPDSAFVIRVDDTRAALGRFASAHRHRCNEAVWLATTGSIGKTTTKELIAHIAGAGFGADTVAKADKSFNNDLGVPLTVLKATNAHRAIAVEIGTNAPGEIRSLAEIVRPDIGVITCAAPVHLEGLGDLNGVAREKGALIETLNRNGVAVLPMDDVFFTYWKNRTAAATMTVSESGNLKADWRATRIEAEAFRLSFRIDGPSPELSADISVNLSGKRLARNALLAIAAVWSAGVPFERIIESLPSFRAPQGRQTRHPLANDSLVIEDCYNASPVSFMAAVEHLAAYRGYSHKTVVAGDMLELGESSAFWHKELGQKIAKSGVDRLVAVGRFADMIIAGARAAGMETGRLERYETVESALIGVAAELPPNACVLVKASNGMGLWRLVEGLRALHAA